MNQYVLDTSVVTKLFLDEQHKEKTIAIFKQAKDKKIQVLAPYLLFYEVNHVLVKKGFSKDEVHVSLELLQKQITSKTIQVIDFPLIANLIWIELTFSLNPLQFKGLSTRKGQLG